MKMLVTGYGRHGKDTFCKFMGLPIKSSSEVALEEVIWPLWGHNLYDSLEDCFNDRINNRKTWFDLIVAFNEADKTRLTKVILAENDVYCGLRNKDELEAADAEGLFNLKIWVDASKRLPPEDSASCTITPDMCDLVVDNNGTEEDLYQFTREFVANFMIP